jgi:hypothetical protein
MQPIHDISLEAEMAYRRNRITEQYHSGIGRERVHGHGHGRSRLRRWISREGSAE